MITDHFMLDNNALGRLIEKQRGSAFVRERCRIPSEVLYEARGFRDIRALEDLEYPTTARVLRHLVKVMARIPANDIKLVNLYANRGNGDPYVIACALDAMAIAEEMLLGPSWVVVTDDKELAERARDCGVDVQGTAWFRKNVERSSP